MLYNPSFCCHCGEKIQAADRNLFSSRRFCDVCKEENKGFEILGRIAVLAALLLPLSILGGFLRANDSVTTAASQFARPVKAAEQMNVEVPGRQLSNAPETTAAKKLALEAVSDSGEPNLDQKGKKLISGSPPNTQVFYCGATTKKGTLCTRKVKAKGNCWQHSARLSPDTTAKVQSRG